MGEWRGFILQPTYRRERDRTVVLLYGRLESGESFLVRDDRAVPHFYVREEQASRAEKLGAPQPRASERTTLRGEPVVRVDLAVPSDTPRLRSRLHDGGVATYEADVRFAMRYLIDRGIQGGIAIEGDPEPGRGDAAGIQRVFDNPTVTAAQGNSNLRVLSFDIETDPGGRSLYSIGLEGVGAREVLLLTPEGAVVPDQAIAVASERELLELFCRRVREIDPDIITGWNIADFDFPVLARVAKRLEVVLELGRARGPLSIRPVGAGNLKQITIPGRVVLDGIPLLRGAFIKMQSYALDAVSKEVLGQGKTVTGTDRGAEIQRLFREDRARFVEYNLTDCRLVLEILDELRLVELSIERSRLTGMPLDRVASSVAAFDFLYLSQLHIRKVVAPTVGQASGPVEPLHGGYVMEPLPGLYEHILVFDFKSLYPSIMRTFQIDPLGHVPEPTPDADLIRAPNGAAFAREPGILPGILDRLMPAREAAKRDGNAIASQAIKILMNSMYGVLGTPACRFFNSALANAITAFGRELLLWIKGRAESHGYRVLYGDTDSIFVESGATTSVEAATRGRELCATWNAELADHVAGKWGVESRLELEFEQSYRKLHLPEMRHSSSGARKRYAGWVEGDGGCEVEFTGMEAIRSDWTELAHRVQQEMYERLFTEQPVKSYLKGVIADLREGRLDPLLVYKKSLRKRLADYTATTPPHVAAARKMTAEPGRVVSYVWTADGPEPAEEQKSALDYEHYLRKQIQPIADPVLALLGIRFESLLGGEEQLELF